MTVCVYGLCHLGSTVAACLSSRGFHVIGLDPDQAVVRGLQQGAPPLFEPDLDGLIRDGIAAGHLVFTADASEAVPRSDIVWVAFDTPVDDDDNADTEYVMNHVRSVFGLLRDGAIVIVSSQLPVGSVQRLEQECAESVPRTPVSFACMPENLRLGSAINAFMNPERVVIGVRDDDTKTRLSSVFAPVFPTILWVGVESAEMTKHALNAFLAASVAFINEIATVCECVGADVSEVEAGLRSEPRIGNRAYIRPGSAFGGGTLARDVVFLTRIGEDLGLDLPMLSSVKTSNDHHRGWAVRQIERRIRNLDQAVVGVWGLSYKVGTSAVRRSVAVEICRLLAEAGARVRVHDPVVRISPPEIAALTERAATPLEACRGADALVIATEWPEYAGVAAADIVQAMRTPLVIDANGFMRGLLDHPAIHLVTIGRGG